MAVDPHLMCDARHPAQLRSEHPRVIAPDRVVQIDEVDPVFSQEPGMSDSRFQHLSAQVYQFFQRRQQTVEHRRPEGEIRLHRENNDFDATFSEFAREEVVLMEAHDGLESVSVQPHDEVEHQVV